MHPISPVATTPPAVAVALPADLPAPAVAGAASRFPDSLVSRSINSLSGVLTTTGDEREVGTADPNAMIPVGSQFMPAVGSAVAQSKAGVLANGLQVDPDAMLGVFRAQGGGYFVSPILASASPHGDMLILNPGDQITSRSAQLVAVADANAWDDLSAARQTPARATA